MRSATTTGAAGDVWWRALISAALLASVTWASGALGAGADPRAVRHAQVALRDAGHDPGQLDGLLGPRTRAAIARYQRAQGLTPTGDLDAETLRRLDGEPRDDQRVRSVQQALKEAGHDPGPADGVLGPRTKAALRSYAAAPAPDAADARRVMIDEFWRGYAKTQSP